MLILESAPGARDLVRHHARGRFSCGLARKAGRALAILHAISPAMLDGASGLSNQRSAIRLHEQLNLASAHELSPAALELTR